MRLAFALLAAGFLAVAAAIALPCWFAGFPPDALGVGLPLAGFVLAVLAAALFPRDARFSARLGASDDSARVRVPAEGGRGFYGPENGPTDV